MKCSVCFSSQGILEWGDFETRQMSWLLSSIFYMKYFSNFRASHNGVCVADERENM